MAWELFSPAQRFLIVAVIGVAVSESKKNGIINQLKESVELRVSGFNLILLMCFVCFQIFENGSA